MHPHIRTAHPDLAEFLASSASSEEHLDRKASTTPEPRLAEASPPAGPRLPATPDRRSPGWR